jgi:hypothetical protein
MLNKNVTKNEEKVLEELNMLSEEEQRKHFLAKCKEFSWTINYQWNKNKKDIRNFHVNIMDSYVRQILRTDYVDKIGKRVYHWSIWTQDERLFGNYGDIMFVMISILNSEKENGN